MNNVCYKLVVLIAMLSCSIYGFATEGEGDAATVVAVRPTTTPADAEATAAKAEPNSPQAETNTSQTIKAVPKDTDGPAKGTDLQKAAKSAREAKAAKAVAELPPPTPLETKAGIQIVHIAMTAASGLVDFRFKILDAVKAKKLLADPANMPMLIAGDNPPLHPPHNAMRGVKYGNGAVNYILYPNTRNAIKPGIEVKVAIGDVRLGPVKVQ